MKALRFARGSTLAGFRARTAVGALGREVYMARVLVERSAFGVWFVG